MPWLDEGGQPVSDTTLLQTLGTPPAAPAAGAGMWKDESGNPVSDPALLQSLGSPRGMGGETGGKSGGRVPFSNPMPSATAGAWDAFTHGLKNAIPSMGRGVVDSLAAGGQGTSPDVANGGYVRAPQSAQAMFDETGKVPDEQNMAALRDPDSGKYAVYYRNPDAAEGRLTSAARAITSGLVAAGPPGTGAAIGGALSPILNGAKTVGNIVGVGSGETKALSKIAEAVAASEKGGGPGALDMTGQIVGGTGKQPVALVDLSPELQGLYGQAARVPGPGRTAATSFLQNRDAGAGSRLSADVNEALGGNKSAFQTAQDVTKAQSEAAGPLYEEAFAKNKAINSPTIDKILDTPAGKRALADARVKMQNDRSMMGRPDAELGSLAREQGLDVPGGVADGLNLRSLDYVKRAFDDQIGTALNAGERDNARILVGLKKQFVSALDEADITAKAARKGRGFGAAEIPAQPGKYAQARAAYSGPAQSLQALDDGAGLFKMQPEEIAQKMADLSEGDKHFFRLGAESAIRKNIAQTGPAGDEARALLKNNYVQQQLRPIFGSQADFDKVINAARNEALMAKTKSAVLGNSQTAARLAQDASGDSGGLLRPIAEAGAAFGTGEPILGAKAAYSFMQTLSSRLKGMTPEVAENIVKLLGDPSMSGDIARAHAALAGPRRLQISPGLLQPAPGATAAGGLLSGNVTSLLGGPNQR